MFHCNLNWMPRYCLIAKNFWLTLSAHHCAWTLQRRKDIFRAHFLYCLVITWKKKKKNSWQISLPAYWSLKSLNVEKILAVKYTTILIYAAAQRKPDKNKKFRPAEIRTLTSAIPVQWSNQYVLYCHWTVSNASHIYFTLPPHLYSVHIQYTFSKVLVVYIKRYAY